MLELNVFPVSQELVVMNDDKPLVHFLVSTAKNGLGEVMGSEQTPRGLHRIRAKIGAEVPINAVFKGRRPTGEIYSEALAAQYPERDWILTRILWLQGLEPGFNRFGKQDSMCRYIYIHGTPDSEPMGIPLSKGCIRMHNHDLIKLFDLIEVDTKIYIHSV